MLLYRYNKICFLNICAFSVGLQYYSNLFIRISINNIVKCTKMCSLLPQSDEKNTIIKFDDIKYFSIQVMLKFSSRYKIAFLQLQIIYTNYVLFLGDEKEANAVSFYWIFYSILFIYHGLYWCFLKKQLTGKFIILRSSSLRS